MRGHLIQPFVAHVFRLDTTATVVAGVDDRFRKPKLARPLGPDQPAQTTRRELAVLELQCQVEVGERGRRQQGPSGNVPDDRLVLVFHMRELEEKGLVDSSGSPKINVGDRLGAIYKTDGTMVKTYPNPPGLYATKVSDEAFGLGRSRNLVIVTWDDRPQGLTAAP